MAVTIVAAACAPSSPSSRPSEDLSGLLRPSDATPIECGGAGAYAAEFIPGSASNPVDSLQVVFSGTPPTPSEAEAAVRRCIEATSKTVRIDSDMLANAWFNEEGPLPLTDGSKHLAYFPDKHAIESWDEHER